MKNRNLITLLLIGIMLVLTACGSSETDQESVQQSQGEPINVTNDMIPYDLFSCEDYDLRVINGRYTKDASDIDVVLQLNNKSNKQMYLYLEDITIDGTPVLPMYDFTNSAIEPGNYCVNLFIALTELQEKNLTDFKEITCNVVLKKEKSDTFYQGITFNRDIFLEDPSLKPDNPKKEVIDISQEDLPYILSPPGDEKYDAAITGCTYTTNASDIEIEFDLQNHSGELMAIYLDDIKVDDVEITELRRDDESDIKVGRMTCWRRVHLENLQAAGVSDFKKMECKVIIKVGDEKVLKQKIRIDRAEFVDKE